MARGKDESAQGAGGVLHGALSLVRDNLRLLVLLVCTVVFLALLGEVLEGEILRLDVMAYELFVERLRSDALTPVVQGVTSLASVVVLAVMALVWAADSGAYFTGRAMGKNKLIPAVSPNKTREGLYGGLATAILVMMLGEWLGLYSHYADDQLAFMVAGLCAIGFSVLGDLVESMLKRMTGVKDSGRLFPGHGGMLDRIDSQLAALPLFVSVHALVSGQLV